MKAGRVELLAILDRSGSMYPFTSDTISGFNKFLDDQKKQFKDARISVVLFDDRYEMLHDRANLADVPNLNDQTYSARGTTALLDAVGKAIATLGQHLRDIPEDDRPERVTVMIITDGEENSSHEYSKSQIKKMIDDQTNMWKWQFMYLGANQDAFAEAGGLGIPGSNTFKYAGTSVGTRNAYAGASMAATLLNTTGRTLTSVDTQKIQGKILEPDDLDDPSLKDPARWTKTPR